MPPFRSTPKWPCQSTQPEAFSVARPKKSALPLKSKNQSPGLLRNSSTAVSALPLENFASCPPPTSTSTDVLSLITSSRLTVPSMCSLNDPAVMSMPLTT